MYDVKRELMMDVINHYNRMIDFVDKLDGNDSVCFFEMAVEIHEEWSGEYCSFCEIYGYKNCRGCFLFQIGERCDKKTSLWKQMTLSPTWGTWLKYAKKLRRIFQAVL